MNALASSVENGRGNEEIQPQGQISWWYADPFDVLLPLVNMIDYYINCISVLFVQFSSLVSGDYGTSTALACGAINYETLDESMELLKRTGALQLVRHQIFGQGLLYWACRWDVPVDVVVSIFNIDHRHVIRHNSFGSTPLHRACWNASEGVVALLLNIVPHATAVTNYRGELPLHAAIRFKRSPSVIKRLLAVHPTAVYAVDKDGRTPFSYFIDEWKRVLDKTYPGFDTQPRGRILDGGLDGHNLIKETFLLLMKAHVLGAVEDTKSTTAPLQEWLPLHEVFKHHGISLASNVFLVLNHTMYAECVKQDVDGNFLIHNVCTHSPVYG